MHWFNLVPCLISVYSFGRGSIGNGWCQSIVAIYEKPSCIGLISVTDHIASFLLHELERTVVAALASTRFESGAASEYKGPRTLG